MKNQTNVTPPTKVQLDVLIDMCLRIGQNEAAGSLKLGSDLLSEYLHRDEETCCCLEVIGDNKDCPKHGHFYKDHGPLSTDELGADYKAHYQERNDLYLMGMGG